MDHGGVDLSEESHNYIVCISNLPVLGDKYMQYHPVSDTRRHEIFTRFRARRKLTVRTSGQPEPQSLFCSYKRLGSHVSSNISWSSFTGMANDTQASVSHIHNSICSSNLLQYPQTLLAQFSTSFLICAGSIQHERRSWHVCSTDVIYSWFFISDS